LFRAKRELFSIARFLRDEICFPTSAPPLRTQRLCVIFPLSSLLVLTFNFQLSTVDFL
jgi:hypothetical protein